MSALGLLAPALEVEVPNAQRWLVRSLFGRVVSSGAGGNRTIEVDVIDPGDVVVVGFESSVNQMDNVTVNYAYGPGIIADSAPFASLVRIPIPELVLEPRWKFRFYDTEARSPTDAAAFFVSSLVQSIS